jgi:hypothetical protein
MGRKQRANELFQALSSDDQVTLLQVGESLLLGSPFVVAFDGRFVAVTGSPQEKPDHERLKFFRAVVHLCTSTANGAPYVIEVGPASPLDHAPAEVVQ